MMRFKIIEVHPQQHSIVVRYYSDAITESSLADQIGEDGTILRGRTDFNIDLPLPAPTGAALDQLIMDLAPAQWLANLELILDPNIDTSLSSVMAHVGVERRVTWPAPAAKIFDMTRAPK